MWRSVLCNNRRMIRWIAIGVLAAGCVAAPSPPARIAAPEPPHARPGSATPASIEDSPTAEPPAATAPPLCPALLGRVTVTATRLELAEPIFFAVGEATVKEESLPLLAEVAAVLGECPHITVEIQVHTDPRGSSAWNYQLSQARAAAVQQALVERGVAASRLTYQGYGESCPIVSEDPDPAVRLRLQRRTELWRTDTGARSGCPRPEPPPEPPPPGDEALGD